MSMTEAAPNYTDWQISQGMYRREVVERLWFLERNGATRGEALRELKVPESTLRDWLRLYAGNKDWNDLIPKVSTGRKSVRSKLEAQLGKEAVAQVIATVKAENLETKTNGGSWRFTARTDARVPAEIKPWVIDTKNRSKHHIPKSLTDATRVTEAERLGFRGRRDLELNRTHVPRFVDVLPGDVFVADDYTPTWGWWVPWPRSEEYPFGAKLLQGQLLALVDYASLFRPAYALVAREQSSYRAADIWSFYGTVFQSVGLPRLGVQHEGNIWQSNALRGVEVEYQEGEIDRERRVGALKMLPSNLLPFHHEIARNKTLSKRLEIYHSILPKSKPVELAFSMMSKFEGTLFGHLGSDQRRRPNRDALKRFQACQRGKEDPRQHFLSYLEVMERIDRIYGYLHEDPMEGDTRRGKPAELWNAALAEHPLLMLPEHMRFMYRPNWEVRKIAGAFLKLSYIDGATGERRHPEYTNPEAFADLDGEKVLVYYDQTNPEEAAEIVSLRGDHLCTAQYWSGTGAFLHRNEEGFEHQANYVNRVMRAVRIIATRAASRQLPPEIVARRKEDRMERIAAERTPFSPPQAGARSTPAKPLPTPATAPRIARMGPAELLNYQPQVQQQPELEVSPVPTPTRSTYRVKPWNERVHDDAGPDPDEHFHPPRGGVEKTTPLGATQAGSIEAQN